jgi:hypothetical protein
MKFKDEWTYAPTFNMDPSTTSTVVNSIVASSLLEGHTDVTITYDLTLTNLMENKSTLSIDFDRNHYPLHKMKGNLKCVVTTPAKFVGTCVKLNNGFIITTL